MILELEVYLLWRHLANQRSAVKDRTQDIVNIVDTYYSDSWRCDELVDRHDCEVGYVGEYVDDDGQRNSDDDRQREIPVEEIYRYIRVNCGVTWKQ